MPTTPARLVQINVAPEGGVPKRPVASAVIGATGLVGDGQRNLKYHGGPERAVCLWAAEVIDALRAEGHPVSAGSCGENLTVAGLDWPAVAVGDVIRVGAGASAVSLQVVQPVAPCKTIAASFRRDVGPKRISHDLHPGWARMYARVLAGGEVRPGDAVAWERAGK